MKKFSIEQTLNILQLDIGANKFRQRPNHIHSYYPRRKTYTNLWVVEPMPWSSKNEEIPRKWAAKDSQELRFYILNKYEGIVTYETIKDALLCLKGRSEFDK